MTNIINTHHSTPGLTVPEELSVQTNNGSDLEKSFENKALGFISLYRSLPDHWIWKEKKYSRLHAFIYLLFATKYFDDQEPFGYSNIQLKRGQILTSFEKLKRIFGWTLQAVRTFIDSLKRDGIITCQTTNRYTVITVVNYDFYQDPNFKTTNKTTGKQQASNKQPQAVNKENKVNNKKEKAELFLKEDCIYPFQSDKFLNAWLRWKKYKKEQWKFMYISIDSENSAMAELAKDADLNEAAAIEIINGSIANAWKGLFKTKSNTHGSNQKPPAYNAKHAGRNELLDKAREAYDAMSVAGGTDNS